MTRGDINGLLASFIGLKPLNAIDRSRLAEAGTFLSCRAARALYYQGEPSDRAVFVLAGRIDEVKYRGEGSSLIVRSARAGDWVGLAETVTSGPYLADALSREESTVLIFTRERLKALLAQVPLKDIILTTLARGYYGLYGHLETSSPSEKIAAFLRSRVEFVGGGTVTVTITQEALAEAVGYTRETVNRTLASFAERGAITLARGKIVVLDIGKLAVGN